MGAAGKATPTEIRGGAARPSRKLFSNKQRLWGRCECGGGVSSEASSPAGLYFQQSCLLARSALAPWLGQVHTSQPLPVLLLLPADFSSCPYPDCVQAPLLACDIPEGQDRSSLLSVPSRAEGRAAKMDRVPLLTLDSLVPNGTALRDRGVQGQEGHCTILGKLPQLSVSSAVKWDRHGAAQGAW